MHPSSHTGQPLCSSLYALPLMSPKRAPKVREHRAKSHAALETLRLQVAGVEGAERSDVILVSVGLCHKVVSPDLRAVWPIRQIGEMHRRAASSQVLLEPLGRVAHVRISEDIRVKADIDLAAFHRNVQHIRDGLPVR